MDFAVPESLNLIKCAIVEGLGRCPARSRPRVSPVLLMWPMQTHAFQWCSADSYGRKLEKCVVLEGVSMKEGEK